MLKKIRIVLACIMFVGITLLFIGIGHDYLGWMAKVQFLPSVLKLIAEASVLNVAVVLGLILLTLVLGRVYCSVICPLGILQDIVLWLHRKVYPIFHKSKPVTDKEGKPVKAKKHRFKLSFHKENKILRYAVWVIFVACMIAGLQAVVAILAPYSAYGRMVRSVVAPSGWIVPTVAAVTFVVVVLLAWFSGREWCNSICPVGTTLSFFSRFSLFKPTINTDTCVSCGRCEKVCKARCIDIKNHSIDYSRCVDCFDCIALCPKDSLHYRFNPGLGKNSAKSNAGTDETHDEGRRAFLQGTAIAVGALAAGEVSAAAQEMKLDGGLADVIEKQKPVRTTPLVPFGARGEKEFYSKCTACQLCISACPNGVLRPSTTLEHLMQPEMSYEKGYCRPECTECSQVCPAGAILPITKEEKTAEHIGTATVDLDLCVVNRDGVSCGNCSRHCPVGAIMMVPKDPEDPESPKIPTVLEDKCIGCGACEFLCPSRPLSAIHVNGLHTHMHD